jgi:coenzyme F420-reducing hydrogenase alpha subunit
VGGFYRAPTRSEVEGLVPELEWGRQASIESVRWASTLDYPDVSCAHEFVSLRHEREYPMNEGRLVSSAGLDIAPREWERHFVEEQVERSTALHARIADRGEGEGAYLCGPLARVNLNFDRLAPVAREAAAAAGFTVPCHNPFRSLMARTLEILHAFDEALAIARGYRPPDPASVDVPDAAGRGAAITEAPRGSLYHRYVVDDRGLVAAARIVPPTSQNQRQIERDLFTLGPLLASLPSEGATRLAEQAVRSYDPCISCATHFLRVAVERA